jgi:hypothetical protein
MKECSSYNVQIWCGLRRGYIGYINEINKAISICQEYIDSKKECVTVTPTTFVYVGNSEPGFVVGFIRYPRYINSKREITKRALELGKILMEKLGQNRVTITTPTKSIMLENDINKSIVKPKTKKS